MPPVWLVLACLGMCWLIPAVLGYLFETDCHCPCLADICMAASIIHLSESAIFYVIGW